MEISKIQISTLLITKLLKKTYIYDLFIEIMDLFLSHLVIM